VQDLSVAKIMHSAAQQAKKFNSWLQKHAFKK
jgi:hypothetical protein